MTPEEIRAEYVETIARAFYNADSADEAATTGSEWLPWGSLDEGGRWRCSHDARLAVAALAEAGLLPIGASIRQAYLPDGTPLDHRERCMFTGWRRVDE